MKLVKYSVLLVLVLIPILAADLHFDISYHENLEQDQSQKIRITLYNEVNRDLGAKPIVRIYDPEGNMKTLSTKVIVPAKQTKKITLDYDTNGKTGEFKFTTQIKYGQYELGHSTSVITRHFEVTADEPDMTDEPDIMDTIPLSFTIFPVVIGLILAQFYMLLRRSSIEKDKMMFGLILFLLLIPGIAQDIEMGIPSQSIIGDDIIISLKVSELPENVPVLTTLTISHAEQPVVKFQEDLDGDKGGVIFVWDTKEMWVGEFIISAQLWQGSKLMTQKTSVIELKPASPPSTTPATVALSFSPILVLGLLVIHQIIVKSRSKKRRIEMEIDNTYKMLV